MATRGPWSVKGIDTKAREAALQAARSEGVTLGDYLNRLLLEAEKADQDGSSSADSQALRERAEEARRVRDMQNSESEMLDELFDRLENTDTRTSLAVSGIEQSIKGLVSRLDSAQNSQTAMESRIELASDELQQAQEALQRRINRLEADDTSDQTLRALRSLEGALERLSGRVHDAELTNQQNQEAATGKLEQLDSRLNEMSNSVDTAFEDMVSRIEKNVSEAELRSEGAARHLSERMSQIEQTVSESQRTSSDRLDKVENQVGNTLSRVSDTIDRLGKNITENEDRSVQAFDLVARLEEQSRTFREDMSTRLDGVDQSIDSISDRMSEAESLTETALQGLEKSFAQLDDRVGKFEDDFGGANLDALRKEFDDRLNKVREELAETVSATREEFARQLEDAASAPTEAFAEMSTAVSEMNKRLRRTEQRQTQSVEAIGEEVARLTETIDKRVRAIEERNESELSGNIRNQIAELSDTFQKRLAEIEAQGPSDDATSAVSAQMSELAEKLNKRVESSEERSASAIRDFTEHVTTLTKSLQARQEESAARLTEEIKASEARQSEGMERAFDGVNERISQVEAASRSTVSPIQKAMASFAERLQAIEEFSNPGGVSAQAIDIPSFDDFEGTPPAAPKPEKQAEKPAPATSSVADLKIPSIPEEDEIGDPWATEGETFGAGSDFDAPTDDSFDSFNSDGPDAAFDLDATEFNEPDELPDADPFATPGSASGMDYLSRAREAAKSAQEPKKARGGTKAVKSKAKGSGSKLPIIAAASVLAIAAIGTAGFMMMRGKQDSSLNFLNGSQSGTRVDEGSILMPDVGDMTGDDVMDESAADASADILDGEDAADPVMDLDAPSSETLASDAPASEPAEEAPARAETEVEPAAVANPPRDVERPSAAPASVEPDREASAAATRSLNQTEMAEVRTPVLPPAQPAQPNPIQQYQAGIDLIENGRIADGVELVRAAAEDGLAAAQYRVSKLYENGQGVPRDLAQSRAWTARAAEGGSVKAMHDLAVFYANGEGGPLNYAGAVQWFRQAAEYGLVDSQYNLGVLYEQGMGVTADEGQALYWFGVAQKSGDAAAGPKVTELSGRLDPAQVENTLARVAAYTPKPSDPIANGRFPAQAASASPATAQPASASGDAEQAAMIQRAQNLLNELGYGVGVADGEFGAQTRSAILAFQAANGYAQSGQVTPTLLRQLNVVRDSL